MDAVKFIESQGQKYFEELETAKRLVKRHESKPTSTELQRHLEVVQHKYDKANSSKEAIFDIRNDIQFSNDRFVNQVAERTRRKQKVVAIHEPRFVSITEWVHKALEHISGSKISPIAKRILEVASRAEQEYISERDAKVFVRFAKMLERTKK